MLVQAFKIAIKQTRLLTLPIANYNLKKLNTQVFSDLSYEQLANPTFTKALIIKPIHNHSRVSQKSLFHKKRVSGIIRSCFSEKKHKEFRRVNKIKRSFQSQILGQSIHTTVSSKALRTINKMGSFDNYILCTTPKNLDSKYGEYLRELMLRKINDPHFRIPYIIGTNRKLRIKKYQRHLYLKQVRRIQIPKQFKETYRTLQRPFGRTPDELNNEDYAKYVELENLKRTLGDELQPTHPLILELKEKLTYNVMNKEQQARFEQMAKQIQQDYINDPKHGQANRKRVQKAKSAIQAIQLKLSQHKAKIDLD